MVAKQVALPANGDADEDYGEGEEGDAEEGDGAEAADLFMSNNISKLTVRCLMGI